MGLLRVQKLVVILDRDLLLFVRVVLLLYCLFSRAEGLFAVQLGVFICGV